MLDSSGRQRRSAAFRYLGSIFLITVLSLLMLPGTAQGEGSKVTGSSKEGNGSGLRTSKTLRGDSRHAKNTPRSNSTVSCT